QDQGFRGVRDHLATNHRALRRPAGRLLPTEGRREQPRDRSHRLRLARRLRALPREARRRSRGTGELRPWDGERQHAGREPILLPPRLSLLQARDRPSASSLQVFLVEDVVVNPRVPVAYLVTAI